MLTHFSDSHQMPHSNADSVRVFSMVNKICTEHRADLAQDKVAAFLSVKVNSCVDSQRFEPSRNELNNAKSATMEYNRLHLHPAYDVTCSFVEPSLDELNSQREILHHRVSITIYINFANGNMFVGYNFCASNFPFFVLI